MEGRCELGGPSLVGSFALWPWHHTFFYASLRSSPSPGTMFFNDGVNSGQDRGIISSRFSSCVMARPTRELALSSRTSRSSSAGG